MDESAEEHGDEGKHRRSSALPPLIGLRYGF
jgi:hypothetical protein